MKTRGKLLPLPGCLAWLLVAAALLLARPARGQLAITEMMSSTARTLGSLSITNDSDFWELTNFGTNTINLAGYKFSDAKSKKRPLVQGTTNVIHPSESIIFVRNSVSTNESQFRTWWGSCVGSNVQVSPFAFGVSYSSPSTEVSFSFGGYARIVTGAEIALTSMPRPSAIQNRAASLAVPPCSPAA